jgi:hypothetical protein
VKFGYSYKTSDGIRHESTFEAKSNEAVFAALRAQGIKPMKVWEIHSPYYISKRTRLIIILALALAASLVYTIRLRHSALSTPHSALTAPRHQIYGDPATWEDIERDNFATVFPDVGDRILAAYAIPGRISPGSLNLSRQDLLKRMEECKDKDIAFDAADSNEATELKKIVQGMKEELRWYVADGVGSVESYLNRLRERQEEEIRIYERTKNELENCTDNALREERNAALRAMGLRTIPRLKKDRNK